MCAAENTECCEYAMLYGMLICGRYFGLSEISFYTRIPECAEFFVSAVKKYCGVDVSTDSTRSGKIRCYIPLRSDRAKILATFGHGNGRTDRILNANLKNECCKTSFLRGAFLATGTVTDPSKGYHLEFSFVTDYIAGYVLSMIDDCQNSLQDAEDYIKAKTGYRNMYPFVYVKDSTSIENILTLLGAPVSSMQVMSAKMEKNINNNITRKNNLDFANMDRMIDASVKYTEAVARLKEHDLYEALRSDIKAVADLKAESPEMSLSEIAETLGISRSAVNYRLNRLLSIAAEIK